MLVFRLFWLPNRTQERSPPKCLGLDVLSGALQGGLGTKLLPSSTLVCHLDTSVSGILRTELSCSLVYWLKHHHRHLGPSIPLFTTLRITLNHFFLNLFLLSSKGLGLTHRPQPRDILEYICSKQTTPLESLKTNKGPMWLWERKSWSVPTIISECELYCFHSKWTSQPH